MSVHRLKDGRWICQFWSPDKKRNLRKYFGRGLNAELAARDYDDSLKLRSYKRRTPDKESAFFYELVNAYAKAKLAQNQDSTIDNFYIKMNGVILPEIGTAQAIRLTPHRMDQYVDKRLKDGVKRTTIHRELSDIQAVLNWSVSRRYLSFNPIEKYQKPRRDDAAIRPPTNDEISRLIACSSAHLKRALTLAYYSGIRPGQRELLALCWDNIDWLERTIWIESAKKGGHIISRSVPLHHGLISELYIWHYDDRRFAFRNKKSFPDRIIHYRGKPVKSIKKAFKSAKEKAGIARRIRPYDFRHAFATAMLKSEADLKSTSELLGHSRTDTTTRIYQHTDSKMHKDAIDKLPPIRENKP